MLTILFKNIEYSWDRASDPVGNRTGGNSPGSVLSDFLQSCRKTDGRGILYHRESKMAVRSIADELRLS